MKRKTILISGIVVILVAIGVFILLRKPIIVPIEEESTPPEAETEGPSKKPEEKPAETPAEIAGLSSCIVLNEEYCDKGEVPCGWSEDSEIGFNLEEGTKVYAPFDGVLRIVDFVLENDQWSKGIEIEMWPIEEVSRQFLFHDIVPEKALEKNEIIEIKWAEMSEGPRTEKMIKVKKGELIGQTTEGISWTFFGKEYNFVIMLLNTRDLPPYTPEYLPQFYSDLEFLKQYFPYIECEE